MPTPPCAILQCLPIALLCVGWSLCAHGQEVTPGPEVLEESHRLFWVARAARESGELEDAAEAVERAVYLNPRSPDTWYLAGHVAFELDQQERSAECFEEVVALDAAGSLGAAATEHLHHLAWLDTQERARRAIDDGDHEGAREALAELVASAPADVAADAREALHALEGKETRGSKWGGSTGLAVDSNPLVVSEGARAQEEATAVGLSADLWGARPLLHSGALRLVGGMSAHARSYATGPEGADYGRLRASMELSAWKGPVSAWLRADGTLVLLGWRPLLDLEQLHTGLAWSPAPLHSLELRGTGTRREPHLEGYDNLAARGASGSLAWTWAPTEHLDLTLSWSVAGEEAAPYQVAWTLTEAQGGGSLAVDADASFRGHGPRLRLDLEPPWRSAQVSLRAGVQWREYARPERTTQERDASIAIDVLERRDLRWTTDLKASVELHSPLYATMSVSTVQNSSSLDGQAWPIERNFGRTLWVAELEFRP